MSSITALVKEKIKTHLIDPVLNSMSPVSEVAWGAAIGMWWGLTPTVGIQMYIVFCVWILCKYLFKFKFDLIVGTAMVWLSNPLTMFFMYYGFLVTGLYIGQIFGFHWESVTWESFNQSLNLILDNPNLNSIEKSWEACKYLLYDLGIPMLFGSLFYAFPGSIFTYVTVKYFLTKNRQRKARKLGMDYEDWRKKFEGKKINNSMKAENSV
ncbi:MAG: hypothetical protein ACI86H_000005 [bacterium]|jgi:uncharacterized protein (DUF2062 family)